eukprot:m.313764 g.313764  ORF g.313764 m.313764 type:complete len:51 (+) comp435879_c0_seq1:143-295(+)
MNKDRGACFAFQDFRCHFVSSSPFIHSATSSALHIVTSKSISSELQAALV